MLCPTETGTASSKILALVGNPNVGKSALFSRLTGKYVTVSNYPGTTVDVSRGNCWLKGAAIEVVDSPGVLSIFPKSEDERVTRDLLLRDRPEIILQVADTKNLGRSLNLTLELAELKIPMVLALNMSDEAEQKGIEVDAARLAQILGVPVIETVATTGDGIADLRRALSQAKIPTIQTHYLSEVSDAYDQIISLIPKELKETEGQNYSRILAQTLLYQDYSIWSSLKPWLEKLEEQKALELKSILTRQSSQCSKKFIRPISILALDSRQQQSREIVAQTVQITGILKSSWAQKLGRAAMKPWPGYLIALGMLYLMYQFVGVFGAQYLVDLFEKGLFGKILNPAVTKIVTTLIPITFIQEMLIGPYGLFSMALTYALALIFPIVTCFFLFFGILEDSGYLPRLAIMLDRVFRLMGLNGKAVLPMILGLGCDTMATLTTRVLESNKEKIIVTLLLTLSIPCSAQIGAMLGMVAGLSWKIMALWLGIVVGTMLLVGWLGSKVVPGVRSPFLMEIPPIRIPQLRNLFKKIRARLLWYVREAVPMFLLGTFILFISDKIGLLELVKKAGTPLVVHFLGLPQKATESFIIGFLRRDYGAAGFFMLAQNQLLTPAQIAVALTVITLFMPCIAQFFVSIKERGLKTTVSIAAFVLSFSLCVGGLLNWIFKIGWITL